MKKRGIGIACMQYSNGGTAYPNPSAVFVKINEDGSAVVLTGITDVGQGSATVFSQMAAEALGLPLEKVGIVYADTKGTPFDFGTVASRVTYIAGKALLIACKDALDTVLEVASKELHVNKDSLIVEDGVIMMEGYPALSMPMQEAALKSYKIYGKPPIGKGSFNPLTTFVDAEKGQGKPFDVFVYAAQVAEVEVDTETGVVEVLKIYAAHDCGVPINPSFAEGQVFGGIHMGFGYATMEEILWSQDGQMVNPQLTDYMIPTALDMPELECHLITDPEPTGPFGAKGIGEPSLLPTAPAILNAIYDAVGVRLYELPVTPEKVFWALREKEKMEQSV
ncbi:MAG: molybdopterin cofactor-binding domain-containing protein [Bacillota bacterium]|nr:molybdopterin cofactor-binding domain-containing protein [Bacillota bacterium]